VDSLSDRVLASLKKGFTVQEVAEATKHLQMAKITATHTFLLGTEFDDKVTVQETLRALRRITPDRISAQYGVRLYRQSALAQRHGASNGRSFLPPKFSVSPSMSLEDVREIFEAGTSGFPRRSVA
jgi:hypothetical protein